MARDTGLNGGGISSSALTRRCGSKTFRSFRLRLWDCRPTGRTLPIRSLDQGTCPGRRAEGNGVRVSRVSRAEIDGRLSRLHFEYEVTDGTGTRRASEVHELGLFTSTELLQTFQEVGLQVDYDPKGLTDRGLYVARIPASRTLHQQPRSP